MPALLIMSYVVICGLECSWMHDNSDDDGGTGDDPVETEIMETRAYATIDAIDVATMDVETDDGVILTCDLPSGVVLAVGDRVEIIIQFESNESQWIITDVEYFQRV